MIKRAVTQENINYWFEEVSSYLKEIKLDAAMRDPTRVFNADVTAFFLNPKPGKVLAPKGSKSDNALKSLETPAPEYKSNPKYKSPKLPKLKK
ncbi:hypothetical protein RN001_004581 [Aquatica leii]|uniref:Uncharacterized protein n=1 Tax=Aquatica leii TaxID=1421715 RepID=A0AAN7PAW9_9COLE|nr:hypothetical protein RN001_004581 [Aquatica leii]